MNIALLHDHYTEEHLKEVMKEMKTLGAPTIKAVWMDCYGHWAALEGCHRIRAAKELGLVPNIEEVEYSDDPFEADDHAEERCKAYIISEVADDSYRNIVITFEEEI